MADWRNAITNDILDKPDVAPFNKEAGRAKLQKVVLSIRDQITGNKTKVPNRLWSTRQDGSLVITLKLNGQVITVDDAKGNAREKFAIPAGDADAVLTGLAEYIAKSDEFDTQIEAALEGTSSKAASKSASPRKTTKDGAIGMKLNGGRKKGLTGDALIAWAVDAGHDIADVKRVQAAYEAKKKA